MKGEVQAIARWTRLDCEGEDTCRLVREPGGWMLVGHARFRQGGHDSRLDYVVRCDAGWVSQSADVSGTRDGRPVGWKMLRRDDGWTLNEQPVAGTADCPDVDLGFTPATNTLPLRRLNGRLGEAAHPVRALWFRYPQCRAEVLEQTYHRVNGSQVTYASPGFEAALTVDPSGFVTRYPGGWTGRVDAP